MGETEQRLAAMFHDAESDGAVLLLDEADSFLQDRRGALRNHEVSEVNELLQGMEHFRGVFICTTNLIERLDQASLRRFAFARVPSPTLAQRGPCLWNRRARVTPTGSHRPCKTACKRSTTSVWVILLRCSSRWSCCVQPWIPPRFWQLETEHRLKPEVREGAFRWISVLSQVFRLFCKQHVNRLTWSSVIAPSGRCLLCR